MKQIVALLSFFLMWPALSQSDAEPTLELDKTNLLIEFEAQFDTCPGRTAFRAQDGVMVTYNIEGCAPLRFIVKKYGPLDIKFHPVTQREVVVGGQRRLALMIQPGLEMLSAVSEGALREQGLKSLTYKAHYTFDAAAQNSTLNKP